MRKDLPLVKGTKHAAFLMNKSGDGLSALHCSLHDVYILLVGLSLLELLMDL